MIRLDSSKVCLKKGRIASRAWSLAKRGEGSGATKAISPCERMHLREKEYDLQEIAPECQGMYSAV